MTLIVHVETNETSRRHVKHLKYIFELLLNIGILDEKN